MKKNYYISGSLLLLLISRGMSANPTITFFFKPVHDVETINKKIRKPGALAKHTVHGIVQHIPVAGILVTYGGFVATSSYNGEIVLPRKHQKATVTLLITPEIVPIPLFENTILHWNLIPGVPAEMYVCEQKHNDKTGYSYWETKKVSLPEDNKIPLSAIIIIADPKNIVINSGEVITNETANLVLPDIQVKKGINIIENSSYMLTIRHLFKPVVTEEKREPFKMLTHIME